MKSEKFFLFIVLFIAVRTTNAQKNTFDIGLEGGPGIVSLRGNTFLEAHHHPTIGYSNGAFVQYHINRFFSLRTGIYHDQKGSSFEAPVSTEPGNTLGTISGYTSYDYLALPLLLRATFGRKIQFFTNAGAYFGYLFRHNIHFNASSASPRFTSDGSEFDKKTDFGLSAGLGAAYHLQERLLLSAEFRDNLGLTTTSKAPVVDNGSIKHNALYLLLGISYRL